MIDTIGIDIAAERAWLMQHKAETGLSWADLAARSGVKQGTLSQYGPNKYNGDNAEISRKVARYRQTVEVQADLLAEAPEVPGYVETRTAAQIKRLLAWAHRGKLVAIAGGPGIGKSTVTTHYAASASNVWRLEVADSYGSLNGMQVELLAVMGERDAVGTPQRLSRRIRDRVQGANGLIILDQAEKLTEKAIEEARSWSDLTGVGLAFVGTADVIARLEGGTRKAAYAQLYSRVSMRMIRAVPLPEDAAAIAAAWGLTDDREIAFLTDVATRPGGLRSATMVMELASMLALADGQRTLTHLRDAWKQLSVRPMAA